MVKIAWGDDDLETALDEWEDTGGYNEYTGDRPKPGTYQFKLVRLEQTKSSGGFPQLIAHWELAPHKPEHKAYKGYYGRDYIIVKSDGSTAFRVRPLMDALGVTARQFRTATQANKTDRTTNNGDEIFEIFKIGNVKIPGNLVMCHIKPDKRNADYEAFKYLGAGGDSREANDADDSDAGDDNGDEDGGKKAPF